MGRQIYVIGGGAAGLTAAITAARAGASVTILEHSKKMGQKILATGNGRCNLGNHTLNTDCYHCPDPSFVEVVLTQWGTSDTLDFFTKLGIYVKDREGYLYPYSDQASSVRDVLLMEAAHRKVKLKNDCLIEKIEYGGNRWKVHTPGWTYQGESVILATGSPASNISGADNSGYELIHSLGHKVRKVLPALVPLKCKGVNTGKWAGLRMEGKVTLLVDGKSEGEELGEIQMTDYGLSGIPVFQLSGPAVRALDQGKKVQLLVDLLPRLTQQELEQLMDVRRRDCPYKSEQELYVGLLPDKLIPLLPKGQEIIWLKNLLLTVTGSKSANAAQVCSGGVDVSQVNPYTMESELWKGLYFAGEVLDVDGICGGYNLHWAWATGTIAGTCCSDSKGRSL